MLFQPLTQALQIRCKCSESSRLLARLVPLVDSDAGTHTFLVYIQPRTAGM
jgi:hypothetical protein